MRSLFATRAKDVNTNNLVIIKIIESLFVLLLEQRSKRLHKNILKGLLMEHPIHYEN